MNTTSQPHKISMQHKMNSEFSPVVLRLNTGSRLAGPSLVKIDTAPRAQSLYTLTQAKNSSTAVYHPIISTVNIICNLLLVSRRSAAAGQFTCAAGAGQNMLTSKGHPHTFIDFSFGQDLRFPTQGV
jgi:hypothetical protein